MSSSFIWGSWEIIFLEVKNSRHKHLVVGGSFNYWPCTGPPVLIAHLIGQLLETYMCKKVLSVYFYFHIISLIFTVFKLCCPAHLFPNTPRTCLNTNSCVQTDIHSRKFMKYLLKFMKKGWKIIQNMQRDTIGVSGFCIFYIQLVFY
jgi:hypothetical protein